MSGAISKADLKDADILDAEELGATGSNSFLSGVTVVSTTAGPKLVTLSGVDLQRDDERLEPGDTVVLAGTTGGADGTYTVATITGLTTFTVVETIATSTGGTLVARHPVGAARVGFNSAGLSNTTANNVQTAIADMDAAISAGGLTPVAHRAEDVLVHLIAENAYVEYIRTGNKVTQVITWTSVLKIAKIRQVDITYTGNKATLIVTRQYAPNGSTVVETLTETLVYSGNDLTDTTAVLT